MGEPAKLFTSVLNLRVSLFRLPLNLILEFPNNPSILPLPLLLHTVSFSSEETPPLGFLENTHGREARMKD